MPATDEHRPVKLTSPFGKELLFNHMSAVERLGQPFHFDLNLLSENGELSPDQVLGQPVSVQYELPSGGGKRFFHGLVSDFAQVGYGERYHEYQATLRPWFWFLSRNADCRVFQEMSVVDIFRKLATERGFSDFRFDVKKAYQKRVHCVQYRETDFNFLSRLLEEEGIYYFFEHTADKHTMVLVDHSATHVAAKGYEAVPFYPRTDNPARRERDHLMSWSMAKTVQPGAYATSDFDFEKPTNSLLKSAKAARSHARSTYEIFDYPADLRVFNAGDSEVIAQTRLDELQAAHMVARGDGDAAGLAAGARFQLKGHPRGAFNIDYLIVATNCSLASNPYETGGQGEHQFHVSIEAIDLKQQFRAPRVTPKPVVQGAQTAIVVGSGEIETDKYGRVKVRFHWDRKNTSSCWVRVAQVWAGKNWGGMHIPRVGHEVIVDFLEGDPDRPIITGCVYNGDSMPPYDLPANATQSGIKSRSSKGGGESNFNEIRFEDKKGSEELWMQAEKDLKLYVKNDESAKVDKNRKREVGENEDVKIGKKFHLNVGDEITIETGASKIVMKKDGSMTITCKTLEVKASQSVKIQGQQSVEVKSLDVKIDGSTAVTVKSGVNTKIQGAMTKVEGTMLDLSGQAMAKLKGGVTMIG